MSKLFKITCQSANRPENVPKILEKTKIEDITFFVPVDQSAAYLRAGARCVFGVHGKLPMKPKQLNASLDRYKGEIVVTMDDDFINSYELSDDLSKTSKIDFQSLLNKSVEIMGDSTLLGFPTTTNAFYMLTSIPENYGMLCGALLIHNTKLSDVRFDETLNELEDLEYIIQHHKDGKVIKNNKFLIDFHHGENSKVDENKWSGGYKGFRTKESTMKTYLQIRNKHPEAFKVKNPDINDTADINKKVDWKSLIEYNNKNNLVNFLT